jgi:hypothetical protein
MCLRSYCVMWYKVKQTLITKIVQLTRNEII